MDLKLSNFRCFKSKSLNLPESGLVSISGETGSGKTTLLESIKYGLYSTTGSIYPLNQKCKVSVNIKYKDLDIYKQSNPKLLKVNNLVQNEALALINEKFGGENHWNLSGYISQGCNHPLLEMNSKERVDIITDIAVKSDINIDKFFDNLLIKLDTTKVKLDRALKKFDIRNEILKEFRSNHESKKSKKTEDELKIEKSELREELEELKKKKINLEIYIKRKPKYDEFILEKQKLEKELSEIVIEEDIEELKQQLKEYKRLNKIKSNKHYLNELNQIKNVKSLNEKTLQKYKACLEKDYDAKLKAVREKILDIEDPKIEIDSLTNKIKNAKLYKELITCPECNSNLRYDSNKHKLFKESIEKEDIDISKAEREIRNLKKQLPKYQESERIKKSLKEVQKPKTKKPEKSLKVLYSLEQKYLNFTKDKKEFEALNTTIEKEIENFETNKRKEFLISKVKGLKVEPIPQNLDELMDQTEEKINKTQELQNLKNELNIKVKSLKKNIKEFHVPNTNLDEELSGVTERLENIKTLLEQNEKETILNDNYIKLKSIEKEVKTLQEDFEKFDKDFSNLTKIRESFLNSISEVINVNFIDDFNLTVNSILEDIFDEQIIFNMKSFRENKTNNKLKPDINFEITYKGSTYNKFNMLSGGERSRLNIALLIAFSKKVNKTKLIILDETMSSLNAVMKERVVNCIRKNLDDFLVLVVNHDTTEGIYDHVIQI